MKKIKTLLAIALFFSSALLNAEFFFSGNTGIAAKFANQDSRGFDPKLNIDGFFAGQFDFENNFFIRGEFSVQTGDVYDDFFQETQSIFRIDELSATYFKPFFGVTHFISLFLGTFEPIGGESYLQHYLGALPYHSLLTENYLSQNGCNVYDFYGFGAAYSVRFNELPLSTGLLIYKNNNNANETAQLNFDWRIGAIFEGIQFDCTAGIGAPMNTKNAQGDDVVLLIDTLYLHTGIDVLIGDRDGICLFGQMGFENLPIRSSTEEKKIEAKNLYLLVEPRFNFEKAGIQLSVFNMPLSKAQKTLLLEESFGADLCVTVDSMIGSNSKNVTFGNHLTMFLAGKDLMDLTDDDLVDSMELKISPFAKFKLMGGEMNIMLQANIMKIADDKPDSMKLTAGYKKVL